MNKKEVKKAPALRFKGFTNDWEERKLGEHAKYRRGSFPQPYGNKEWYDGEGAMPFVQVVDVTNKLTLVENTKQKISKLAQSKSVFVPKGTVVVTLQGSIGRVAITQYDSFVDRTLLIFEDYEKETDERFWAYTIQKKFEIEKLKAPGGTIKTITKEALSSFDVHLPQFKEQAKIGSFFKQLDDTIALQQRKLDLLKEQKKGYLQKMFPKNGAKVPELRFAGFADDWEERKLGDIFSERSERSGEGELISVTINSGVIRASELNRTDNSSDDKSNYKKVEVGDIAYNSMRMWQGASGYSPYEGILSPAYTVIFPKEGIDSKFFSYDFKRYDMIQTFKRNSQGLTSDTWNLKFPTLKSVKVMVPCFEEQKQISNFFESVDKTIALHQRKLDLLKEQKKGFLQKMFV
ncbi:restriction endonuclease subunit S [Lactobacillus helveticus]|uniref:Type I restriction modification DNA specificity domain protein n=1 Tax=Lactobacillus helveticus CIRM-BIA 951 TaxID=1226334 RepID=U6F4H5_LACHE|nr:restriction endonuclease subunit S [Lactobacillus helveticus]MDY0991496.1 restriction endonuclease subunit S [Lactobacillus helveticus]MDY1002176.1 restriction endonuclease subunit S [Lactobacillus helveticus]MEB2873995.1 restriction endonuclease subunit S [Lactobacillus helveticus]NRO49143.1 hypothetical protein [Lactobacillus helveticus]NRO74508.1 hypothetical protein [Lactobacillus helveticus]